MRSLTFISLAVILIAGLLFTSCKTPATTPASTTAPAPTTTAPAPKPSTTAPTTAPATATAAAPTVAQTGGVLKVLAAPGLRNIGLPGGEILPADGIFARPAVEALLGMDEAGSEAPVPQLATSWQFSPDYKSLTFNLRKGVKFHDGTDFNAQAAKTCLDLVRVSTRPELKPVSSIDVIDDYTIRLNLSSYEPSFLGQLIGMPTWMVSPTALKTLGKDAPTHPVGTGPFKFVSYQRDTLLKYEKFDGYWQKGKPYLDGINFVFIANDVTRVASFKAGEGHSITVAPNDANALKAAGKYNTFTFYQNVLGFCGDNGHPSSVFSDLKVRQAMAYAVDNEAIAKALGQGYHFATNQWLPPDRSTFNKGIVGYPYNVAKAKQLLTEAGYPNGFETTLIFSTGTSNRDLFTAVQGYLAKVGIKVKLDEADAARFRDTTANGWHDGLASFDAPASVGYDLGRLFVGRISIDSHRYDPMSLGRSTEYDNLLAQSNVELDATKRLTMLKKLMKMIIDDYCIAIPLYAPGTVRVDYPQVRDLTTYGFGGLQDWQPAIAWLSK